MVFSSAVAGGGGGAAVAVVPSESKFLPSSSFFTILHLELNCAIAAKLSRGGSVCALRSASALKSEEPLAADFGRPVFLQGPIHVHAARRSAAGEEVSTTESNSYRPNEAFLISPALSGETGQLANKTSEEGLDHRETRGFSISIGAIDNARSDQSSRELNGMKSGVLFGTEEVGASNNVLSTTPYTRAEGPDPVEFVIVSAVLLFVFWLGNYVVPDLVFKNTVFKEESNTAGSSDTVENNASDASKLTTSKEESFKGKFGRNRPGESDQTMRKVGTGFGGSKERQSKNAKWK